MNQIKIILISVSLFISVICKAQKEKENEFFPQITNRNIIANLSSLSSLSYVSASGHKVANFKNADVTKEFIIKQLNELDTFIDIQYNEHVQKYIELYTNSKRYEVEIMLGLTSAYLPLFEKEVKKLRLPENLKYFPVAVSSLNPVAMTNEGAVGIWQIYYTVGKIYHLNINTFVDERRSPEKSSPVAVRYLKDMYKIYYDWDLALAAYVCSPANVNKAIARSGGKRNFWEIYNYLPEVSREIIPAYIAILYLVKNYQLHNITPPNINLFKEFDTVQVKEKLHLGQVAGVLNFPSKELSELNPVYRKMIIHPAGKYTTLKLPKGQKKDFLKLQDSIYNYLDTVFFKRIPDIVLAPKNVKPTSRSGKPYTPPSVKGKTKLIYTVKSGDNLGFIASWYGVKIADIKHWNSIYRNKIIVGDKINIFVDKNKVAKLTKVNTMTFEQKQKLAGKTSSASKSTTTENKAVKLDPRFVYHKVRSGDNPWIIAKKYPGISAENIEEINKWAKGYKLYPGQYIKIKRK